MRIHRLKNEWLEITVADKGAELQSIFSTVQNRECLWQGDATYWNRKAPVLFPFVGKLKNNRYIHKGKEYIVGQHGFARDMEFTLIEQSLNQLHYSTDFNEETLTVYPFRFRLEIIYTLHQHTITCSWRVHNIGNEEMYFSIGAHPGFFCPFHNHEYLTDFYLEFSEAETTERCLLNEGIFNGQTEKVFQHSHTIELHDDLFLKDAIVLKHINSSQVTLKSKRNNAHSVGMTFNNFPYLGIWKKPGSNFLCIEPWHGLADNNTHTGDLINKEGILYLSPYHHFETSYSISIF